MEKKQIQYILTVLLLFVGTEACYTNYQNCYGALLAVTDRTVYNPLFCTAITTAKTCLEADMNTCGSGVATPALFTQYLQIVKGNSIGCQTYKCQVTLQQCILQEAQLYTPQNSNSNPTETDVSAFYCPKLKNVSECYQSAISSNCQGLIPPTTNSTIQRIANLVNSYCSVNGDPGKCLPKMIECNQISSPLPSMVSNINLADPASITQNIPTFCPYFLRLKMCYQMVAADCPKSQEVVNTIFQDTDQFEAICGSSDCFSRAGKCMEKIFAVTTDCDSLSNLTSATASNIFTCCSEGRAAIQCLRGLPNECNKIVGTVDTPAFSQSCRGYENYCPGLELCYQMTGVLDSETNVCLNVDKLLTCVEEKCQGRPNIGKQTISKIKTLYGQLCSGLTSNTALGNCKLFSDCVQNSPLPPGTIQSVQSYVGVRDTDRWCKIAKHYVHCAETKTSSCAIGVSFSQDVITMKAATDETCSGVRDPCPTFSQCIVTLTGNQTELSFAGTCPNIPDFANCAETSLGGCGSSSRVQANYSMTQIGDLFSDACSAIQPIGSCAAMARCLDFKLPVSVGDHLDKFSDQTFWCRHLRDLTMCAQYASQFCSATEGIIMKLTETFNSVKQFCPDPNDPPSPTEPPTATDTPTENSSVIDDPPSPTDPPTATDPPTENSSVIAPSLLVLLMVLSISWL